MVVELPRPWPRALKATPGGVDCSKGFEMANGQTLRRQRICEARRMEADVGVGFYCAAEADAPVLKEGPARDGSC